MSFAESSSEEVVEVPMNVVKNNNAPRKKKTKKGKGSKLLEVLLSLKGSKLENATFVKTPDKPLDVKAPGKPVDVKAPGKPIVSKAPDKAKDKDVENKRKVKKASEPFGKVTKRDGRNGETQRKSARNGETQRKSERNEETKRNSEKNEERNKKSEEKVVKKPDDDDDSDVESDVSIADDEFSDTELDKVQAFDRPPTLRVSRRKGVYRVKFQPIRLSPHEPPLLPLSYIIPDVWSDDEARHSDDGESDLDVEYIAPAAFMSREVKRQPLTQVMKQSYDYEEVEKHFAEIEAEKDKLDDKDGKGGKKSPLEGDRKRGPPKAKDVE